MAYHFSRLKYDGPPSPSSGTSRQFRRARRPRCFITRLKCYLAVDHPLCPDSPLGCISWGLRWVAHIVARFTARWNTHGPFRTKP